MTPVVSDVVRKYQEILKTKGDMFKVFSDMPTLGKDGEESKYFYAKLVRDRIEICVLIFLGKLVWLKREILKLMGNCTKKKKIDFFFLGM